MVVHFFIFPLRFTLVLGPNPRSIYSSDLHLVIPPFSYPVGKFSVIALSFTTLCRYLVSKLSWFSTVEKEFTMLNRYFQITWIANSCLPWLLWPITWTLARWGNLDCKEFRAELNSELLWYLLCTKSSVLMTAVWTWSATFAMKTTTIEYMYILIFKAILRFLFWFWHNGPQIWIETKGNLKSERAKRNIGDIVHR